MLLIILYSFRNVLLINILVLCCFGKRICRSFGFRFLFKPFTYRSVIRLLIFQIIIFLV